MTYQSNGKKRGRDGVKVCEDEKTPMAKHLTTSQKCW